MGRFIGTAGERIIEEWCALSGITANRSEPDRHGWDLHFEMPSLADITLANGLHEANIECKVQIKATDTKKKTEPIELSNLHSMATSALPTFYILLEYAGGQQLQAAHLLHIDETICAEILERIRRETAKPGKLNLHKKTKSLNFKKGVKIQPLNGEGLKSEILKFIGPSQSDYVIKKQTFIKSCGFEEKSYKLSFQVDIGRTEQFVNMLLGGKDSLEVKDIETAVTRFGISEQLNGMRSHTAVISVTNIISDSVATVIFRNRKSGTALEFNLEVYRGGAAACVPSKFRVIRLKSKRFSIDISMHDYSMKIYFTAREDDACEVSELLKHYKFIQMLSNPSDVALSIEIDGKTLSAQVSGTGFEGDFDKSVEILEAAIYVKNFYEYYGALDVIPNWFMQNGYNLLRNTKYLKGLNALNKVNITFTLSDGSTELTEAECILAVPITIGDLSFVSLLVYSGNLVNNGNGSYELFPSKVSVLYKTHFTNKYLASGKAILDLEEAAGRYEGTTTIVLFIYNYMDPLVENAKRALGL